MGKLNDEDLTREGLLPEAQQGRSLLIACGALAREIIDLQKANGWDHMVLTCLPAIYHLHPEKIPGEVRRIVAEKGAGFQQIFVVYADCGTGGMLQKTCDELGVEMVQGPHCYSFFEGNDRFAEIAETNSPLFT